MWADNSKQIIQKIATLFVIKCAKNTENLKKNQNCADGSEIHGNLEKKWNIVFIFSNNNNLSFF